MEMQTTIDMMQYGAVAASIIGAGVAGAVVAYKRLYGRREDAAVADDCYRDLSRKLESLASRVELLESSIRSLPTAANVLDLVKSLNEVDRRLAKIEGYVMGKQALAD